jgi:hypothetical protein
LDTLREPKGEVGVLDAGRGDDSGVAIGIGSVSFCRPLRGIVSPMESAATVVVTYLKL